MVVGESRLRLSAWSLLGWGFSCDLGCLQVFEDCVIEISLLVVSGSLLLEEALVLHQLLHLHLLRA